MEKLNLKTLLETSFNEAQFQAFTRELFGSQSQRATENWTSGNSIPEGFRSSIKSYKRLNKHTYIDTYGFEQIVDVLIVKLTRAGSVERARNLQRNFVERYLNGGRNELRDAALVAFLSEDEAGNTSQQWRLSLITVEYERDKATGKPLKLLTPAKRSSFLVGEGEHTHTAQTRLNACLKQAKELGNTLTIEALKTAFNIEKVSKEFFEQYKALFKKLYEELERLCTTDAQIKADFETHNITLADFAKKTLGQLVFLQFLQKKGWLGVPQGKPWGSGDKNFLQNLFNQQYKPYDNFFNDIVEPLFYEALAIKEHKNRTKEDFYTPLNCRIPFLNGGLFEPLNNYAWDKTNITIDNHLFEEIFNTFNLFNFTVKEDEPLEKEVAVDPEMLGKVFEELLEVKDRKSKGAFYTPREIVHYMCQESLIQYLHTQLSEPSPLGRGLGEGLPTLEDIRTFIQIAGGNYKKKNQAKDQLPASIKTHAHALDTALATITVCDPAIGSGAFPVGMLHELVRARQELTHYLVPHPNLLPKGERGARESLLPTSSLREEEQEKEIPHPNLLPKGEGTVALEPSPLGRGQGEGTILHHLLGEGVVKETAALEPSPLGRGQGEGTIPKGEERTPYALKRHAIETCIYGVDIDAGAIEIAKLRFWLALVVDQELTADQDINPLPNLDFKLLQGNSLLGCDVPRNLLTHETFTQLDEAKHAYFNETNPQRKTALKDEIKALKHQLTGRNDAFDFKIDFYDVLEAHGGFDVVIGNPPYVRQEEIKELKPFLKPLFKVFNGTADLYTYFYEQGHNILKPNGTLNFITSNKWMRTKYGEALRGFLLQHTHLEQLIDFGGTQIFETATVDTNILFFSKTDKVNPEHTLTYGNTLLDFTNAPNALLQNTLTAENYTLAEPAILALKKKIATLGKPLKDWDVKINYGIKTGYNEAFIIDETKRQAILEACQTIEERERTEALIRPILRGRDIHRWQYQWAGLYIIGTFPTLKLDIEQYPSVKAYLQTFGERLKQTGEEYIDATGEKIKTRKKTGNAWFETQDQIAYVEDFSKPKIIYPDIDSGLTFTYDNQGFTLSNTAYFFTSANNKFLLGVLNAKITNYYYAFISSQLGASGLRHFSVFIENIPIPQATEAQQAPILQRVAAILALTQGLPHPNPLPKGEGTVALEPSPLGRGQGEGVPTIAQLEAEIDVLVYQLYNLTYAEVLVVQPNFALPQATYEAGLTAMQALATMASPPAPATTEAPTNLVWETSALATQYELQEQGA